MSDETTLLPCPFCGEEPWEPLPKRWTNAIGDVSWSASVHCPECEITVDTECGYETVEAAIEAAARKWNTRTDYHGFEQAAIEAWKSIKTWNTRTHGTLTAEQVRKAVEANAYPETSITFEFKSSSWQAIADELNATLGGGECEMEFIETYEYEDGDEDFLCKCSNCGRKSWEPAHDLPNDSYDRANS